MKTKLVLSFWMIVFALVYFHATDAFDQDLGRHLKLGEIIVSTKEVPKTNLFSFTNPNEPVFNSHWGSQVIFYGVHKAFGIHGLIILSTLINTLAFGMLFLLAARRAGLLIPSILVIPFLFILLDRAWVRPEMFGNLFYAIILLTLFVKRVRERVKWFFPLMSLFWINLHITAVFGVFAMAVVLLQDSIEQVKKVGVMRGIRENALILAVTLLALIINPYGFDGIRSAFTVLDKYGYTIVENQSWLFLKDFGFSLVAHIFFGFFVLLVSFLPRKRRPSIGELLLLLSISVLTLRFVRNEILFAYTAFLTASLNFAPFRPRKAYPFAVGILIVVAVLFINHSHNEEGLPIGLGNRELHKNGVDFFLANDLKGPIFNNFDIGGYLIYRLYPKELVFVDNRPEAYPVWFFDLYKEMQYKPEVFEEMSRTYGFTTIIWGRRDITPWSYAFLEHIQANKNWGETYRDDAIVIYTKVP